MAVCEPDPKPAMYGLGIRLAFYLQWFGALLLACLDTAHLADIRHFGLVLSAAATLALIIQTAGSDDTLQPADTYITLLLAAGSFVFFIPLYIWRALTLCNPRWDPFRASREKRSPFYRACAFVLVVAVAGFATWFFLTELSDRRWEKGDGGGCQAYGFLFSKVGLGDAGLIAFNAIWCIGALIVCAFVFFETIGFWPMETLFGREHKHKPHSTRRDTITALVLFSNCIVFALLIAAVELSIQWNSLDAGSSTINHVDTTVQLVPLILSAVIVVRSVCLFAMKRANDENDDDGHHHHHRHHHRSGSRGHSSQGSSRRSRKRRRRGSHGTGLVTEKTTYRRTVVDEESGRGGAPQPPPPPAPPPVQPRR